MFLIIYAISWLFFLLSLVIWRIAFGEEALKVSKDEWWVILIVLAIAPIWPFIFIYLLVDSRKERKERKQKEEQLEREEQKLQMHKNEHAASIANDDEGIVSECIALGKNIVELVNSKQYDKLISVLGDIRISDGCSLKFKICEEPYGDVMGDSSFLYVLNKDGEKDKDIFQYIEVSNTYRAAWQVFILYKLWHLLPMFWHGNYERRTMVFTSSDLSEEITLLNKASDMRNVTLDVSKYNLRPQLSQKGNEYFVSCCYWNNWEGLVREVVGIVVENNKVTEIVEVDKCVEHPYDCGIRF